MNNHFEHTRHFLKKLESLSGSRFTNSKLTLNSELINPEIGFKKAGSIDGDRNK